MLFIGWLGVQDRGRQQVAVVTKPLKKILNVTLNPQQVVATLPLQPRLPGNFACICDRVIQDSYTFFD
jgi:hypothetical protein